MKPIRVITSLQNDYVKAIRALEMRKVRKESGLFVAEGAAILVAARDLGFKPVTLVYRTGSAETDIHKGLIASAQKAGAEVLEVAEHVLGKIASKDNPQTMLGVFKQRWADPPDAKSAAADAVWLVLDEVRDPGNLGTIIRTADAAGAAGIILAGNCCDPYSLEATRATMGSVFAVKLVRMTREAFLAWRAGWAGDVVATHLDAAVDFRTVTPDGPALVMMGSEGPGLPPEMADAATVRVKIPMSGKLDSLNLAIATALVLYQVRGRHLTLS